MNARVNEQLKDRVYSQLKELIETYGIAAMSVSRMSRGLRFNIIIDDSKEKKQ